jgi:hypothetical protein
MLETGGLSAYNMRFFWIFLSQFIFHLKYKDIIFFNQLSLFIKS